MDVIYHRIPHEPKWHNHRSNQFMEEQRGQGIRGARGLFDLLFYHPTIYRSTAKAKLQNLPSEISWHVPIQVVQVKLQVELSSLSIPLVNWQKSFNKSIWIHKFVECYLYLYFYCHKANVHCSRSSVVGNQPWSNHVSKDKAYSPYLFITNWQELCTLFRRCESNFMWSFFWKFSSWHKYCLNLNFVSATLSQPKVL